jgi:hypothetical protein
VVEVEKAAWCGRAGAVCERCGRRLSSAGWTSTQWRLWVQKGIWRCSK